MLKFKITRGVAAGIAVVGAFALSACVGDKSEASPAVAQLGSSVKVSGSSGWSGKGDYSGTVTVDPGPACALDDDGRVVVFHVRAGAEKGSVPTGNWRLQTGNADPVSNGHFNLGDFAGPLIGSPVDTDKAWGDIAFHLPPKTVPTRLQLFAGDDRYSNSPGVALAQWATPMEVKASVYCSGPLQAAVKRETPVTN